MYAIVLKREKITDFQRSLPSTKSDYKGSTIAFAEYLTQRDANVWMVDYRDLSAGPVQCYLAAVYNLPSVGKCTALMVRKIMELSEVEDDEDLMHLVAFSLGAHLAGQIAEHLKPTVLPRITGKQLVGSTITF